MKLRFFFSIFALLLSVSLSAQSANRCEVLFTETAADRFETTFEDLGLESPEIEAKFLIPSEAVYESMKSLVGQEIYLKDIHGHRVRYTFEMNKEHIYEDTNFDTKDLALFNKRGMLRQRVRYDRKPGEKKYKFAKAVFQAKNGPSENGDLDAAVFARNEIRGTEFKKLKKFLKNREELLAGDKDDDAIAFAREYANSSKKFKPVLEIKDDRFFMTLKSRDPGHPWFYVSLDDVKYTGLIGREGQARRLELEAELNDDLTQDTPEAVRAKLALMDELSRVLGARFGLTPSPESKYESGIQLTVLDP